MCCAPCSRLSLPHGVLQPDAVLYHRPKTQLHSPFGTDGWLRKHETTLTPVREYRYRRIILDSDDIIHKVDRALEMNHLLNTVVDSSLSAEWPGDQVDDDVELMSSDVGLTYIRDKL